MKPIIRDYLKSKPYFKRGNIGLLEV